MAAATPNIELFYFDAAARAEPIRLAFAIGGVPFKDTRVKLVFPLSRKHSHSPVLLHHRSTLSWKIVLFVCAANRLKERTGLNTRVDFHTERFPHLPLMD